MWKSNFKLNFHCTFYIVINAKDVWPHQINIAFKIIVRRTVINSMRGWCWRGWRRTSNGFHLFHLQFLGNIAVTNYGIACSHYFKNLGWNIYEKAFFTISPKILGFSAWFEKNICNCDSRHFWYKVVAGIESNSIIRLPFNVDSVRD